MSLRTLPTDLKQERGILDTGLSSTRSNSAAPKPFPQSSKISIVKGGDEH